MNEKIICIYHKNCADGFGAAWVVHKALGDILYHAAKYGSSPPDINGKDVFIVDFSYPRSTLIEMAKIANSIVIIDHHKTAIEDLVDLPNNIITIFDIEHSGAMLTWNYFFPNQAPPQLLLHIEDRDLWKFKFENTRLIMSNVFSFPYDFLTWDTLMSTDVSTHILEGSAIERKQLRDLEILLPSITREMIIAGYQVPVANLPFTFTSDAASMLAKGRPFAACYCDTPNGRTFGLRSTDDGIDVANIAKIFGGGGHRNASGFTISSEEAAKFDIVKNI